MHVLGQLKPATKGIPSKFGLRFSHWFSSEYEGNLKTEKTLAECWRNLLLDLLQVWLEASFVFLSEDENNIYEIDCPWYP